MFEVYDRCLGLCYLSIYIMHDSLFRHVLERNLTHQVIEVIVVNTMEEKMRWANALA